MREDEGEMAVIRRRVAARGTPHCDQEAARLGAQSDSAFYYHLDC